MGSSLLSRPGNAPRYLQHTVSVALGSTWLAALDVGGWGWGALERRMTRGPQSIRKSKEVAGCLVLTFAENSYVFLSPMQSMLDLWSGGRGEVSDCGQPPMESKN